MEIVTQVSVSFNDEKNAPSDEYLVSFEWEFTSPKYEFNCWAPGLGFGLGNVDVTIILTAVNRPYYKYIYNVKCATILP